MIEANIIAIVTTKRVSQKKKSSLFCLLSYGVNVYSQKKVLCEAEAAACDGIAFVCQIVNNKTCDDNKF